MLDEYQTLVSYEENILSNPQILRYDKNSSNLFIYDAKKKKVLELDNNGSVCKRIRTERTRRGEFLRVDNIFLVNNFLYVVDGVQFRITKFALNGELVGSLNYGKDKPQTLPPPAPLPLEPRAKNINNKPAMTAQGNVLQSNFHPNDHFNALYSLYDWQGRKQADIGEIPEGSSFALDFDRYQASIEKREVPAYYRSYTFPVIDRANEDEIFLIYSAFPRIAKYNTAGKKLWETDISESLELDSLTDYFYKYSEKSLKKGRPTRIGLRKYISGISDLNGHLYLALGKYYFTNFPNRLWIHEFDSNGKLIRRYKVKSKDVNLPSIFDIDFSGKRIFVVTKEAEVRVYPF
ncbi:MAG: hypothetical protein U5J95_02735 [Balneolaceae bacterium]|nr:hypothetical protein [Balneolaceae bacterium]